MLVIAALGNASLALFYGLVDVLRTWSGAPFKYAGMNSIVVYACSGILGNFAPFSWRIGDGSHAEFLAGNAVGILSWLAVARVLYLKKIFITL